MIPADQYFLMQNTDFSVNALTFNTALIFETLGCSVLWSL